MENKSGIYKLYWEKSPYFYYGQTQNFINRKKSHKCAFINKNHGNKKLQHVFNKYGLPIFEIIERCEVEHLDNREQYYIDLFFGTKHCCNLDKIANSNHRGKTGNDGRKKRKPVSELTRERLRIAGTGRKYSDITKSKIGNAHRGKVYSEATRDKISKGRKGIKYSQERKDMQREIMKKRYAEGWKSTPLHGELNGFYGKTHSEKQKDKWKISRKGLVAGDKNGRARLVINLETGIFYGSIKEAQSTLSISYHPAFFRSKINGNKKNNTSFIYA